MARKAKEISWDYPNEHPHIGIRLKSFSDIEYPEDDELLVFLDTGWSGGVVLPIDIYDKLELGRWEEPDQVKFTVANGNELAMLQSKGILHVPKLKKGFKVKFLRSVESDEDTDEIIIGIDCINIFKLLLDGPNKKSRLSPRHK